MDTQKIVAHLREQQQKAAEAQDPVAERHYAQQVIAYETLERLRAEKAPAEQIRYWESLAEPVELPAEPAKAQRKGKD